MAKEIERKFLVRGDVWRSGTYTHDEGTHDMAHFGPTRHHWGGPTRHRWGEVRCQCFYRNDRYLVRADAHSRR